MLPILYVIRFYTCINIISHIREPRRARGAAVPSGKIWKGYAALAVLEINTLYAYIICVII